MILRNARLLKPASCSVNLLALSDKMATDRGDAPLQNPHLTY